jgi:hypothetical protein
MGVRRNLDEKKYIKNGKEVYNFPDQTDVTLDLETVTCAPDKAQNKAAEAVSPEQVIDNVEFKVEWKRKEYLRPAKIIMYKLTRQPMSPTGFQLPTSSAPRAKPNSMSVKRDRPLQMTVFAGAASPARAR